MRDYLTSWTGRAAPLQGLSRSVCLWFRHVYGAGLSHYRVEAEGLYRWFIQAKGPVSSTSVYVNPIVEVSAAAGRGVWHLGRNIFGFRNPNLQINPKFSRLSPISVYYRLSIWKWGRHFSFYQEILFINVVSQYSLLRANTVLQARAHTHLRVASFFCARNFNNQSCFYLPIGCRH